MAEEYEKADIVNIIWFKRSFNQEAIAIVPKMMHTKGFSRITNS